MGANIYELGQTSLSDTAGGTSRPEGAPAHRTFVEDLRGLSIQVFEWFYDYNPSHIEAFIASFFCFAFAIAIFVVESLKAGRIAIVDLPVYFLIMSGLFFLMGKHLRRRGQR